MRQKMLTVSDIFFRRISLGFSPLIGQKGSPLARVSMSLICLREVRFRVMVTVMIWDRFNPYPNPNPNDNRPEESNSNQSEARIPDLSYGNYVT